MPPSNAPFLMDIHPVHSEYPQHLLPEFFASMAWLTFLGVAGFVVTSPWNQYSPVEGSPALAIVRELSECCFWRPMTGFLGSAFLAARAVGIPPPEHYRADSEFLVSAHYYVKTQIGRMFWEHQYVDAYALGGCLVVFAVDGNHVGQEQLQECCVPGSCQKVVYVDVGGQKTHPKGEYYFLCLFWEVVNDPHDLGRHVLCALVFHRLSLAGAHHVRQGPLRPRPALAEIRTIGLAVRQLLKCFQHKRSELWYPRPSVDCSGSVAG